MFGSTFESGKTGNAKKSLHNHLRRNLNDLGSQPNNADQRDETILAQLHLQAIRITGQQSKENVRTVQRRHRESY